MQDEVCLGKSIIEINYLGQDVQNLKIGLQ
jgi:hypothetical protein